MKIIPAEFISVSRKYLINFLIIPKFLMRFLQNFLSCILSRTFLRCSLFYDMINKTNLGLGSKTRIVELI